jgi:hypothetical protein
MNQTPETIIDCPNCGQKNRISNSSAQQNKRPICSKCWTSLVQKHEKKNVPPPPKPDIPLEEQIKKGSSGESFFTPRVIFVIIVVCILGWLLFHDSSEPNRRSYSPTPRKAAPVLPSYPEQSLPYNGAVQKFTTSELIAPLEIRGGSGSNYLVKLVNAYTKDPIMTIFVHSGSTATVDVPLGNYEFRYASGEKWYGYKYLFGPNTSYSKADKTFDFIDTGSQISGYTITLYKVSNGNLRTSRIEATQF